MSWHSSLSKAHQIRRGNKYSARRVEIAGEVYRSSLEAEVHAVLKLMERTGKIKNIRREQSIQITPSMKHTIDFVVFDVERGIDIGIEAKGFTDSTWREKQKCYRDFAVMPIQVWMKKNGRVGCIKEIPVGKFKIIEKAQEE